MTPNQPKNVRDLKKGKENKVIRVTKKGAQIIVYGAHNKNRKVANSIPVQNTKVLCREEDTLQI